MASVLTEPYFQDEGAAFDRLETIVWPNGPTCPHCGNADKIYVLKGVKDKKGRERLGLKKCAECRKQFTVRIGTVFESSHISLHVWFQTAFLMCSSKKGVSANQLHRTLGVTLQTAWFMAHRLREAMATRSLPMPQMGGSGAIVEIDETFIGQRKDKPKARGYAHKHAVMTLIERGKGSRSFHVEGTAAADLLPIIKAHVSPGSHVMTDEAGQYAHLGKYFTQHDFVRHSVGEYGRGGIHVNTVEGFYSVFKRGMKGVYQHCAEHHLHRYVAEFDFRYSNRVRLGIDDIERTSTALAGIVGKRLTYRPTTAA